MASLSIPTTTRLELEELIGILAPHWPELRLDARAGGLVCEGDDSGGDAGGDKGGDGKGGDGKEGDAGGKDDGKSVGDADTAALKTRAEKAEQAAARKDQENRELKRANEERERSEREAGGKFDELYQAERDKTQKLEAKISELEGELTEERDGRKTDSARTIAIGALVKASSHNPNKAVAHLDLDGIENEAQAEKAVNTLRKEEPYLFEDKPTRQKRGGGDSDDNGGSSGKDDEVFGPSRLRRSFAGSSGDRT